MLNIYLDEKGTSVKIQLPNIFKDHHIVAQPTPTTVGYDVRAVYRFHVYFHVRLILHELGISLPQEHSFSKVKMLTLRVHIIVFVMTTVLIQMKHGCMETGFMQQIIVCLVMK